MSNRRTFLQRAFGAGAALLAARGLTAQQTMQMPMPMPMSPVSAEPPVALLRTQPLFGRSNRAMPLQRQSSLPT